jgi:hypothetical protein
MAYSQDIGREFWFAFDLATLGTPAFMQIVARSGARGIQTLYRDTRAAKTYPRAFLQTIEGRKADWATIADTQTWAVETYLGTDWYDIQAAFEDFGQGTLLDTRPERGEDTIHMMDAGEAPPVGYHRWHGSIRAIQLLGIGDLQWWEKLDTIIGLAWGIQSIARPRIQLTPNPNLAQADLQNLRNAWQTLGPAERDAQFDLPAGQDFGYHPSPMNPVAIGGFA